jgi:SAM-dependent methyltransferase
MNDVLAGYAAAATPALIAGYDALPPAQIYAAVIDLFPGAPSRIVDIGAGTGRDAAWLAAQGHLVLAVEPVREFRDAGAMLHGDAIAWRDDTLPDLAGLEGPFDLVLLCAVWHHLDPAGRARAMPNLARITAPGGTLILSLRHEPGHGDRSAFPAPPQDTIELAAAQGFELLRRAETEAVHEESRAAGVHWTWLAFAKPG